MSNQVTVKISGNDIESFEFVMDEVSDFESTMASTDTLITQILDKMPKDGKKNKKIKQDFQGIYENTKPPSEKRIRLMDGNNLVIDDGKTNIYADDKRTKKPPVIEINKIKERYIDGTPKQLKNGMLFLRFVVYRPKLEKQERIELNFTQNLVEYPDNKLGHTSSPFIRLSSINHDTYSPETLEWLNTNMRDVDETIYLIGLYGKGLPLPKRKTITLNTEQYMRSEEPARLKGGTRKLKRKSYHRNSSRNNY